MSTPELVVQPLHDRVLLERDEPDTMSSGGVFLPVDTVGEPQKGTVLAVGPDVEGLEAGQRVLFGKYAGEDVVLEGVKFLLVRHEDIFATIRIAP